MPVITRGEWATLSIRPLFGGKGTVMKKIVESFVYNGLVKVEASEEVAE